MNGLQNEFGAAVVFALCLLLAAASLAPAAISIPELPKDKKPDKNRPAMPPPMPVPVAAEVTNGGSVQIPLRLFGKQEQTTAFIIRKGPELGKIVSVTQVEPEVSVLTYKHTSAMNGEARIQDRILFAAQNKNGTSAAAEIVITIADIPPELDTAGSVDFGKIPAGLPATRIVTVSNKGGGLLVGTAQADAPWSIQPSAFSLRQGEKALFQVTLAPDGEREFEGRLHFVVGDEQFQPTLRASAHAPFTVEPAEQTLSQDLARSGTVKLTNRTDYPLDIRVEANERLNLPLQLTLTPHQTSPVEVRLDNQNPESIDSTVRFTAGPVSKLIRVQARRLPEPPQPSATPAAPKMAAVTAPPVPSPTPFRKFREAERPPEPERPPMGDIPGHTPPPPFPQNGALDPAMFRALGLPNLPRLNEVALVRAMSEGIAELGWPALKPSKDLPEGVSNYRIEARQLSMDEKGWPVQKWNEIPNVRFTRSADKIRALLPRAHPGAVFTVRAVALNREGEPHSVSFPVQIAIPVPKPFFTPQRFLLLMFTLILAGALGYRQMKARRAISPAAS